MAIPHNGHGTLADESWQAIFSNNNTGLPSNIIATATDERDSLDESLESLCRRPGHIGKIPWSVEEVLKMIVGVASTTPETGRKRWQETREKYFEGLERTENKLKQKWKDLKEHAINKADDEQRLFYVMAAMVEVEIQSDKTEVFKKVIKEWCVTSERIAQAIAGCDWLKRVKNMELEQQLNEIKDFVTVAEQSHAYDKIRYWSY